MSESPAVHLPLELAGWGVHIPTQRIAVDELLRAEAPRVQAQLGVLSPALRARFEAGHGITCVACLEGDTDAARRQVVTEAIERAALAPGELRFIVDLTALDVSHPGLYCAAQASQAELGAGAALALSVRGAGCAGYHLAFDVARRLLASVEGPAAALLLTADRAPDGGRACLPISWMADGASALVLRKVSPASTGARLRALHVSSVGEFATVLSVSAEPFRVEIDGARFERRVLPMHFVMLSRLLDAALTEVGWSRDSLDALVYPNTTELDRSSLLRVLGLRPELLVGPGPSELGHAFANDIGWGLGALLAEPQRRGRWAVLAAGSGFTWGVALVER